MSPATRLHKQLVAAGVPINGVSIGVDNSKGIVFRDASAGQITAANAIADAFNVALETRRDERKQDLEDWWITQQQVGITPAGKNYQLGMTIDDVSMLTAQYVLAQAAVTNGVKTALDTFIVIATDGSMNLFTLAQLTSLLLDYGSQRSTLAATYMTLLASIEAATTIAALNAIEIV